MSETVDVNLLVYASSASSPFHARARAAMKEFADGPQLRYLLWPAIMGYLRIITDRRIIDPPLSAEDAVSTIDHLLARPNIVAPGEADGFWPHYRAMAGSVPLRGKAVPDAHLVALMRQHGIGTIWTHDRDFRRFDGIRVRDPFAPPPKRG